MAIPPLYLFSDPPPPPPFIDPSLLITFFWHYSPNEISDKHKNKLTWRSSCSCLEDQKTMLHSFL